jgi:hypothetical protein
VNLSKRARRFFLSMAIAVALMGVASVIARRAEVAAPATSTGSSVSPSAASSPPAVAGPNALVSRLLALDQRKYCEAVLGSGTEVTSIDATPFGYRCLADDALVEIDTWEACRLQYGESSRALLSEALDPAWYCTPGSRSLIGEADLDTYCNETFGESVVARVDQSSESKCAVIESGFLGFEPIRTDQACQSTFHPASWADENPVPGRAVLCFEPAAD